MYRVQSDRERLFCIPGIGYHSKRNRCDWRFLFEWTRHSAALSGVRIVF